MLSFRELLPMLENFNRALAAVPPSAVYLKQLHADDTLHPACLEKMVAAAERDPSVALVVSRFYLGSVLSPRNAPAQAVRLSGRTVAKETLLGTSNILGTPSVPLMRIDRLVGWPSLFRVDRFPPGHPSTPPHNQGDKESCLATLEREDVAFLPEPLVSLRDEGPSATGFARRVGGWHATRIDLLLRLGPRFMDEDMLRRGHSPHGVEVDALDGVAFAEAARSRRSGVLPLSASLPREPRPATARGGLHQRGNDARVL